MYSTDIARDIYDGNLEVIQKAFSDTNDVHIYTINHLMRAGQNEEYRISLIPLILKGEADRPGHFLEYKKVIDYLVANFGIDFVIFNVQQPNFFKYDRNSGKMTYIKAENLVSPQMRADLNHIQMRREKPRENVSSLLGNIDEEIKAASPKIKEAAQIVKRYIVSNYRSSHPKLNER